MLTQHDHIMSAAREKLASILLPAGVGGLLGAGAGLANAYFNSADDNPTSGSDYLNDALTFGLTGAGIGGLYGGIQKLLSRSSTHLAAKPHTSSITQDISIGSGNPLSSAGSITPADIFNSLSKGKPAPKTGQIGNKERTIDKVLAKYNTDVFKADHDARYLNKQTVKQDQEVKNFDDLMNLLGENLKQRGWE